ncbi:MAG TPA: SCO family protein [Usitatibacteraceae bacterium]|nr:SCO family protein [Usitatibacteraceae bacterium]
MGTGCRPRWPPTAVALFFGVVLGTAQARAGSEGVTLEANAALERSQRVIGNPVGDYAFKAVDGSPVNLSQFRGRPLLVSFIYTACSQVCPTTTRFLANAVTEADRTLGPGRYAIVTIGFNFPFDTPEAMRAFARQQGIDRRDWHFLSPEAGVVEAMTADLGFSYAASAGGFDHLTQVTLLDESGRVAAQVYGERFELSMLVGPLKALLTDAPLPKVTVANLLERVRLLCTVYDPRTGRYRLDYSIVIELVAGASILLATLVFLLREWSRFRRRPPAAG